MDMAVPQAGEQIGDMDVDRNISVGRGMVLRWSRPSNFRLEDYYYGVEEGRAATGNQGIDANSAYAMEKVFRRLGRYIRCSRFHGHVVDCILCIVIKMGVDKNTSYRCP